MKSEENIVDFDGIDVIIRMLFLILGLKITREIDTMSITLIPLFGNTR